MWPRIRCAAILLLFISSCRADRLSEAISRLSEEAEIFRQAAPQLLTQETLEQREFRGSKPRRRVLVSEYSFGWLHDSPGILHEFRKVMLVNGKRVQTEQKARQSLTLGLKSPDDHARKRLLEEFKKYGLDGIAVDLAPLLLLFSKRQVANFQFRLATQETINGVSCEVLSYRQVSGPEGMLVVAGRQAVRQSLEGKVFFRASDLVPCRITLATDRHQGVHTLREEAVVDYVSDPHGFLAPVQVEHRSLSDGEIVLEDLFRYAPFRKFGAEAEIKFTEVPEPTKH